MSDQSSFLDATIQDCSRPYSQSELKHLSFKNKKKLRLGDIYAIHDKCGHKYLVKCNGRKEKEIIKDGVHGNCSVCWRLSKLRNNKYNAAKDLIESYYKSKKRDEDARLFYYDIQIENIYHSWVYFG